jgi:hypothetical protein
MEKILQILAVFSLLLLLIWRSIRGREERFRRLSYLTRLRPPLPEDVRRRLVVGVFGGEPGEADAYLVDEERRLVFRYRVDGKLTVHRRMADGRERELQELSVPMDCSGLAWDAEEQQLYLEEGGDLFVYGPEG